MNVHLWLQIHRGSQSNIFANFMTYMAVYLQRLLVLDLLDLNHHSNGSIVLLYYTINDVKDESHIGWHTYLKYSDSGV